MLALRMALSPVRAPRPRCTPGALHGRALPPGARAGMHPPLPLPFRTSAAAAAAPAAAAIAAALGPSRRGRPGSRGPGGRAGEGLKGATARFLAIFPGERPRSPRQGPWFLLSAPRRWGGDHAGARAQGWPPQLWVRRMSASGAGLRVRPGPRVLLPPRVLSRLGSADGRPGLASREHEGPRALAVAPRAGGLPAPFKAFGSLGSRGPGSLAACFLRLRSPAGSPPPITF